MSCKLSGGKDHLKVVHCDEIETIGCVDAEFTGVQLVCLLSQKFFVFFCYIC